MERKPSNVMLMLGGNESDTFQIFEEATILIINKVGEIVNKSSLYISEPWGEIQQPNYLNQAIMLKTFIDPKSLLIELLEIEAQLGRKRLVQNGPRTIDIDILFYSDLIINEPDLQIPHPRMHLRRFNLVPVNEIASDWIHPFFRLSVKELLEKCVDPLKITLLIN